MIYVHIPFCRSFCTYCDFYSEVASGCRAEAGYERFADAIVREIEERAGEMSDDVNTLYIGGGTPSVLPLSVFRRIVSALETAGHEGPYDEFTVEVNPDDIVEKGPAYVEGLLELGVNRVSMGVQSFDDEILRWMNRRHDSAAARKAYSILESAGVRNISIDLIFGLPQLSDRQWRDTLGYALEISSMGVLPQHISSYQLSVEPGSALAGMVSRGVWSEASEDLCARQYDVLCETLASAGYDHYEISNFARPGHAAVHNSAYWRHLPYVGLGPGAHSFSAAGQPVGISGRSVGTTGLPVTSPACHPFGASAPFASTAGQAVRMWNNPDLNAYVNAASFADVRGFEELTPEQLVLEHIMLALRTSEGIDAAFLHAHADREALSRAISSGDLVSVTGNLVSVTGDLLIASGDRLRIPESRFFVSDSIISELI